MKRTWIGMGLLAALLGAGAFWDGLYAPEQQLVPAAVIAVVSLGAGAAMELAWWEALALAAMGVGALLSLWQPAGAGNAAHGLAVVAGWLLAFGVGRSAAAGRWVERTLNRIWALLGPLMVFGGLAAMSYLGQHQSHRLQSFLGYPVAVGVLGLLGLTGTLPLLRAGAGRSWACLLAWGNLVAILLSGSRGVWAVGLVLLAYLAWANRSLLRPLWWPALAALAAALWTGPAVAANHLWPALLPFLLMGLTVAAVSWFPRLRIGGAVVWVAAAAAAPGWGWLLGRAAALPLTEGSSVERLIFIKDGLRLAARLPLGAGYRAWTALHLQGASYSYYSAEVHSAPLDLTLAFGWLGGLAFLVLLARFVWGLRRGRRWDAERLAALAGLGALGLHALADWDLSYGLFAVPLWLGFGLLAPNPGAGRRRLTVPRGAAAALAGLTLAGAILLGAGDVAVEAAGGALDRGQPALAERHASLAVAVNPWSDLARAAHGRALGALGRRDEAIVEFDQARRLGPYEPWYAELQAQTYVQAGSYREAAAAYREFVRLWPWYVPAYEAALEAHLDMAFRADMAGDRALAADLVASGRAILDDLDRQKAKEPPKMPRKPMDLNTPTLRKARDYFRAPQ